MISKTRAFAAAIICGGLTLSSAFGQANTPAPKPAPVQPAPVQPKKPEDAKPAEKPATPPPAPTTVTPATPVKQPETAPANKDTPKEQNVYVQMKTSMGDIVLELDAAKAPISVENFLKYVDKGYYDGTIFHRVIDGFMIQGGGFGQDMNQKPTEKPIKNEWKNGLKNKRGTIAMARTSVADSATSQFFINVKDNDMLDAARDGAAYAVFGKVISGMDTVDKIRVVKTGNKGGMGDVPMTPVIIEKVKKLTAEEAAPFKAAPATNNK